MPNLWDRTLALFGRNPAPAVPANLPPNVRVEMTEVPWGPEEIRRSKRLIWWIFSPVLLLLTLVVLKVLSLYLASWVAATALNAGNYQLMESAAKVQAIVNVIEPHRALHNLGVAYTMQGRYAEAKEQLDDALWRATPPDVCLIRFDLARTWELEGAQFEAAGDQEQAIRSFEEGKKILDAQEVECMPPEQDTEDESEEDSEDQSEDDSSEDSEDSSDDENSQGDSGNSESEDESESEAGGESGSEGESEDESDDESKNQQGGEGEDPQESEPDAGEDEQPSGGEDQGDQEQPSGGEDEGDQEQSSGGDDQGDQQDQTDGDESDDPSEGEGSGDDSDSNQSEDPGDQQTEVPDAGDGQNQDNVNEALQQLLERITQKLQQLQQSSSEGEGEGDDEVEQPEPDENGTIELPEVLENQSDRLQQIQDLLDQAWKERSDWDTADRAQRQEYSYTRRPW